MIKSSHVTSLPSFAASMSGTSYNLIHHPSSLVTTFSTSLHKQPSYSSKSSSDPQQHRRLVEAKVSSSLLDLEHHFQASLSSIIDEFKYNVLEASSQKKRTRLNGSDCDSLRNQQREDSFELNDSYSSNSSSGPKKRKRSNFSKKDKELLIEWLQHHSEYPYPTDEEKDDLLERVSMTKDQLETWFVNNRKRLLPSAVNRKTPAMLQCEQFNQQLEQKMIV